jgi:hypothetical protein
VYLEQKSQTEKATDFAAKANERRWRMTIRAHDKLIAAKSIVGSITTEQLDNIDEAQACIDVLKAIQKAIEIEQESKNSNG